MTFFFPLKTALLVVLVENILSIVSSLQVLVVGVFLFLPITNKISALVPDAPQFTRMYNEQDMSPFIYIEP